MRSRFPASAKKSKTFAIGKLTINLRVKICSDIKSGKGEKVKKYERER